MQLLETDAVRFHSTLVHTGCAKNNAGISNSCNSAAKTNMAMLMLAV
jgi:hypothetical protein